MHCLNIACIILQVQLEEMRAQQAAQQAREAAREEAYRQQLAAQQEAHRQAMLAFQQQSQQQMTQFASSISSYFQGLEIPNYRPPPLQVMFTPPPVVLPPLPDLPPVRTPVSYWQPIYCFRLCGHPLGTNEIAYPYSCSRRLRTRLRQLDLLHSRRSDRPGGLRGRQGAPHTTVVATGRRTSEWLGACCWIMDVTLLC